MQLCGFLIVKQQRACFVEKQNSPPWTGGWEHLNFYFCLYKFKYLILSVTVSNCKIIMHTADVCLLNSTFQHHCRKCGGVVCGGCSTKRFLLPQQSSKPLRVCDKCYSQLTNEENSRDIAKPQPTSSSGNLHLQPALRTNCLKFRLGIFRKEQVVQDHYIHGKPTVQSAS